MAPQQNRRDFLRTTTAGVGATLALGRGAAGAPALPGDAVRLGVIGCGWRGGQLIDAFRRVEGTEITAICDPDPARMAEHGERVPAATRFADLRQLFDEAGVDAVAIAACNHWHCLAAIWALDAGLHVYVEKPLFHRHQEGRRLIEAVERSGKVCQVGTQQRSDPMQAEIKAFLHDERALGSPLHVQARRVGVRGSIGKRGEPLSIPRGVDFDLWTGPADKAPILREELHYDWHWDWNTGSGEMGNWGAHVLDDVRNIAFRDQAEYPLAVSGVGGRYVWADAGDTPNVQFALLDTGGVPVTMSLCNLPAAPGVKDAPEFRGPNSGYVVACEGGRLEGRRGAAVALDNSGAEMRRFEGTRGMPEHPRNFIDCVREGTPERLMAPVEVGFYSTVWCDFANIAARVAPTPSRGPRSADLPEFAEEEIGRLRGVLRAHGLGAEAEAFAPAGPLRFHAESKRFDGDRSELANTLLGCSHRAPYTLG